MQSDPEPHIRRSAFNLVTMTMKVVGTNHLHTLMQDEPMVNQLCNTFFLSTKNTFEIIRSGAHRCPSACTTEDLFTFTLPADDNQIERLRLVINEACRRLLHAPAGTFVGDEDGIRRQVAEHLGIALIR
jgi:hypothetical protein